MLGGSRMEEADPNTPLPSANVQMRNILIVPNRAGSRICSGKLIGRPHNAYKDIRLPRSFLREVEDLQTPNPPTLTIQYKSFRKAKD